MPGLIIDGKTELVPGITVFNYKDHPELKLKPGEDMRARHTRWIRSICWHNTKNIPTVLKQGKGPYTNLGNRIAKLWSTDNRNAGAHLSVDWDGTVCCHADLIRDATFHAGSVNEVSIGGEIYEDGNGVIYETQIDVVIHVTIWMCQRFGIQMQTLDPSNNSQIQRINSGGSDVVGVFGHCHQWKGKPDDPGKHVFDALINSGFHTFSFDRDDKDFWKDIQKKLGLKPDGVPGPVTCDALRAKGFIFGLYNWMTEI